MKLLTDFAHDFFGYGNLDAPVWFVGMEEGGGASCEEIEARLASWAAAGRPVVVDVEEFGRQTGLEEHRKWFEGERPPLQATWKQLIRTASSMRGVRPTVDSVRAYQRDVFGRKDGGECLLELLPLPSPGVGEWRYGEWFDVEWLRDREAYAEKMLEHRIDRLRELMAGHQPEAVVFYGKSYLEAWCRVMGTEPAELEERIVARRGERALMALMVADGETTFAVVSHPSAFGVTNAYFEGVGELVGNGE